KNLSRVTFGKLERRYEMQKFKVLLENIETATGDLFTEDQKHLIVKGASERDLVISGLEDIMVSTYHSMNETRHQKQDRKSTRLNSSHVKISYAVFCLKK